MTTFITFNENGLTIVNELGFVVRQIDLCDIVCAYIDAAELNERDGLVSTAAAQREVRTALRSTVNFKAQKAALYRRK